MSDGQMGAVVKYLRDLVRPVGDAEPGDHQLLEKFITHREEAAFAALMLRHGPMVHGLCRRLLQHEQDAEDIFQATFLILARKPETIRKQASLASWLYGVAYRLSLKARLSATRRLARERKASMTARPSQRDAVAQQELQAVVDEELNRLPAKWRAPLILCYLEGKTQQEAAQILGWPAGSMSWRLNRAKDRLRGRLARRGVALTTVVLGLGLSEPAPALAGALLARTLRAALLFADGKAAPVGLVSAEALALAENTIGALAAKGKLYAGLVFLMIAIAAGGAVLAHTFLTSRSSSDRRDDRPAAMLKQPHRGPVKAVPGRVWTHRTTFGAGKGEVRVLALSPDGNRVATLCEGEFPGNLGQGNIEEVIKERRPKIWDTKTGKSHTALADNRIMNQVSCLVYSPDGKTLATAELGFVLWQADTGHLRAIYTETASVARVVFSPDSTQLAFARADGFVGLCRLATKKVTPLPPADFPLSDLAFANNGKALVTVTFDGTVRTCGLRGARPWAKRRLAGAQVQRVLSLDGSMVAAPTAELDDPTVEIWDVATGKKMAALYPQDDQGWISAMVFAPDGKTLATGNSEGLVLLWDLATRKARVRWLLNSRVTALVFSRDGWTLAAGDGQGIVKVWHLDER
jgi:RNA polymerase sigma factor (sigma-70 family)